MAKEFYTILTVAGKEKLLRATVSNKLEIKEFAVGDGHGRYYEPNEDQVALVNQKYKANVNAVSLEQNQITIECLVPSSVGGFTIRELGIYDKEDTLLLIAKYPATEKPSTGSGSEKDLHIKVIMELDNVQNVTITADTNVVIATMGNVKNELKKYYTKEEIESRFDGINKVEIVNNLDSTDEDKALSAAQGKNLKRLIEEVPQVEIVDNLSTQNGQKALSAKQGKKLNETKLSNKKISEMSVQDLNNPNYPHNYEVLTINGKGMGLPTNSAYIKYFSHDNHNGYGTQLAFKVDRDDQGGDNSKLWTMKIRTSSGMNWGDWENVPTSIPKGHYGVDDANKCLEDGMHYYTKWGAANLPPGVNDCIISVYAYDTTGYSNPNLVQLAFSWHQFSVHIRRLTGGVWLPWKELISNDNEVFSLGPNGMTMKSHEKHINARHIEGASTAGLDGALFLNYYNGKPVYFKDAGGGIQTLQGLFQSASELKTKVANKLTGLNVPTSTTAPIDTIVNNIGVLGDKAVDILKASDIRDDEIMIGMGYSRLTIRNAKIRRDIIPQTTGLIGYSSTIKIEESNYTDSSDWSYRGFIKKKVVIKPGQNGIFVLGHRYNNSTQNTTGLFTGLLLFTTWPSQLYSGNSNITINNDSLGRVYHLTNLRYATDNYDYPLEQLGIFVNDLRFSGGQKITPGEYYIGFSVHRRSGHSPVFTAIMPI